METGERDQTLLTRADRNSRPNDWEKGRMGESENVGRGGRRSICFTGSVRGEHLHTAYRSANQ